MNKTKKWRKNHKFELTNYFKKYHLKNKIKKCKLSREWYQKNKTRRKVYATTKGIINSNKYFIKRRKKDIKFRILCNLRKRIWKVLKENSKSQTTLELLSCSIEKLKAYLESKFKKGMTWSNYGKWHIDHIRPCVSFDLSIPEEQKKCFHYTNLQPLWAEENLKKGKK